MLDWITQFIDLIISVFPRFVKIRATHRGVKWPWCRKPVQMQPGLRIVWPLVTEWEVIVVARQTDPLPPQSLTLADGTTVAVKGLCVYEVDNVVLAYGERNWDITSTVQDLSMAAITEVVTKITREELKSISKINGRITRRVRSWLKEYGVSVEKCRLVEVSVSRTIRLLGNDVH
jgi:regulator of protease activity HflC (stomatin/prohibitin superfamily)